MPPHPTDGASVDERASRFYRLHLVNRLKQAFQRRFAVIPCPVAIDVASIKDSNQFVEWVSAPLRGFAPSPSLP